MKIPQFAEKLDLFDFLIKNEKELIAEKKYSVKEADAFSYTKEFSVEDENAYKAINNRPITEDVNLLRTKLVINTTNWLDSHGDVHIQGLWTKTLSETKTIYLLQEHQMKFDKIITSDINAFTQNYTWKQLGLAINGKTEALIFDANITEDRNEFMFKQYKDGYVLNHSVGMRYVKMYLCINDSGSGQYYENWQKYYKEIANNDKADEMGYFWAVTEAKLVEGSAVVMGSNTITPTLDNNMKADNPLSNKEEPTIVTQEKKRRII
jgi:hypothetical protein